MPDEGKLRAEQDRGHRAARILEDDLFREAMDAVKAHCFEMFKDAKAHDKEALQVARISLQCAEAVERRLRYHMETGEMAKTSLFNLETLRRKARDRKVA